ncbi:hypothetical protein Cst_c17170 [Thermoclostridium stercorarium subsp. stercorarium DSM 8532]|jgi:hypothetical protein|uniref:Uncharacterized protein n=2 Tax=Thermoclostridium stercorarium TaxID=1510 RepID=L7VPU7_THES1|nr:hypothetical protein [Thermoclostridium stercorarium]AGC68699.1 hypothetical protein Cst_c17170 [Thermoclostridium stercorarium subsp. stercorarium DSM 8532]AGI39706.1 hypothetical protein Clst_1652 [Thermoclostridium stercorarium subsp. stercorarium DSM 8532]ANW99031.1 hypothetical protein CSTERTH_08325 [Thermoclostridium stercorarium subsp. thermolacticum DSM 2910]UZQ84677.1 hypothetical protein ODU73_001724 [Thermoclostridium stercorarium]
MPKNKLIINAAICDARNVKEETLANYENITINSAVILITPESKNLLHSYGVALNCSDVVELDKDSDVDIMIQNGRFVISASDPGGKKVYLMVNGALEIEPGAEKALERFVGIYVNGMVIYPESLSSYLGSLKVNGSIETYPDDAILLKNTFVVDRTFIKRCKNARYFARKRVVILDNSLDIAEMVNRGVRFLTKNAVIAESLVDAALQLFDDTTGIVTVPDGCSFVNGSSELSRALLIKYGPKLFINGDLMIDLKAADLLEKIEYLHVTGTVRIPKSLEESFCKIDAHYGNLMFVRGKCIIDKVSLKIDRRMLDQNGDGITVIDCVNVSIDEDVPPELILERVEFKDCVNINCFPGQRSAVEEVSEDVVNINDSGRGIKGILSAIIPNLGDLSDSKIINASSYTL